ncbi:SUMF1/EgtB/PvdO family nonheme iron enzyme, partial [Candidatus Omnitrophota bacterium]
IAGSEIMTTVTDSDGYYEFTDVPPGDYSLTAQKTAEYLGKASHISVTVEEPVVVDIVLTGVADIVGTVLLEGLEDNSGVLVYIAGTSYMAMSDSDGSYMISDVPVGTYELVTNAYEYEAAKTAVALETAGADAEVQVITLKKTGAIIGRIVDAVSGAALKNVTVKSLSEQVDTTDADGVFTLDNIPAGSARLSLTLSGYDVRWVEVPSIRSGELTTLPDDVKMYAEGTTPPEEEEQFKEYHTISGTISYVSTETNTLGEPVPGEPIPFARVSILNPDETPTGITTFADGDGHYSLPAVQYGSYKLQFISENLPTVMYDLLIYDDDITFNVHANNTGWVIPGRTDSVLANMDITMASIPAGSFMMGTDEGDFRERPVHIVTLDAFEMSATEITQAQYEAIMNTNPSSFTGDDRLPVETVSWYDAVIFCNTLSDLACLDRCYNLISWECDFTKNGFRLPTEAEWEYACGAGAGTKYYTGDDESDLDRAGWYSGNSFAIHPVGQKEPNAWGLFDMHGNIWEWCNDWGGENYYNESPIHNPIGTLSGTYRVLRGGSVANDANACQTANRNWVNPVTFSGVMGFRVVMR